MLLPDWARKARLGLKVTTRSKQAAGTGAKQPAFGMADLVDFRYELALGDQTLDAEDLAELARLKVPLVRLRGQWVELDDRHVQAALKFLERRQTGTMPAADALLAGLRGVDDDLPLVRWTLMAGWATCCPARPTSGSRRCRRRRRSAGNCVRTRSAAWPGCPSSAISASAGSWPMTWAWARRRKRWRCSRTRSRAGQPRSRRC